MSHYQNNTWCTIFEYKYSMHSCSRSFDIFYSLGLLSIVFLLQWNHLQYRFWFYYFKKWGKWSTDCSTLSWKFAHIFSHRLMMFQLIVFEQEMRTICIAQASLHNGEKIWRDQKNFFFEYFPILNNHLSLANARKFIYKNRHHYKFKVTLKEHQTLHVFI
jgi:hypothetical protein